MAAIHIWFWDLVCTPPPRQKGGEVSIVCFGIEHKVDGTPCQSRSDHLLSWKLLFCAWLASTPSLSAGLLPAVDPFIFPWWCNRKVGAGRAVGQEPEQSASKKEVKLLVANVCHWFWEHAGWWHHFHFQVDGIKVLKKNLCCHLQVNGY